MRFVAPTLGMLSCSTAAFACPAGQHDQCVIPRPWPLDGCIKAVCVPDFVPPVSPNPGLSPVPLPASIQTEIDKAVGRVSPTIEKLGDATLETFKKAGGDTVRTLTKAGGDTFATFRKAADDSVKTITKAAGDATATYFKAWRDTGEQAKRSFNDAVDAGKATIRYAENQAKAEVDAAGRAADRLKEGKVVDSMWGLATEPLKSQEENFAKATQESDLINTAAGSAAAVYGGPAGAAAYASWSTYRRTGDANMALRAGVMAGVTSQLGSSVAAMPAGTAGEVIKKAAVAGAAGGISVAAAGGDEQAIKDGFLRSAGAVLIQGGTDRLEAYSPEAKDAYKTVQCISARDVDCLSNTTWARDAKGKLLYDDEGKPKIDLAKIDPKKQIGSWTRIDINSAEGKKNDFITKISKLPNTEAIPLLNNRWVLTWNFDKEKSIPHNKPTVVLTYVAAKPPFKSTAVYGGTGIVPKAADKAKPRISSRAACGDPPGLPTSSDKNKGGKAPPRAANPGCN